MSGDDVLRSLAKNLRVTAVNYHLLAHQGVDWSVCNDKICSEATQALFASHLYSDLGLFGYEKDHDEGQLDLLGKPTDTVSNAERKV
jgi:hypothetical protein